MKNLKKLSSLNKPKYGKIKRLLPKIAKKALLEVVKLIVRNFEVSEITHYIQSGIKFIKDIFLQWFNS